MTICDFLEPPSKQEWYTEIFEHGWGGSDGSSCSLDAIQGIVIGVTSPHHMYSNLPANLHDWRYQRIRRLGLTELHRKAADLGYYVDCLSAVSHLTGARGWLARQQCRTRYWVLRGLAAYAAKGKVHKLVLGRWA